MKSIHPSERTRAILLRHLRKLFKRPQSRREAYRISLLRGDERFLGEDLGRWTKLVSALYAYRIQAGMTDGKVVNGSRYWHLIAFVDRREKVMHRRKPLKRYSRTAAYDLSRLENKQNFWRH